MTTYLRQNRIRLALHQLKDGDASALLLLHGLGERSPMVLPSEYANWPGPVHALDFTGHGASEVPRGGGYSCELLMGDADAALAHLGKATIAGRGLGAYVAFLLSGGRPADVCGVILRDGPGLAGGGTSARNPYIPAADTNQPASPDPFAIAELSTDARPKSYAANYAMLAAQGSSLEKPIAVCAREQPDWLTTAMRLLGLERMEVATALENYAAQLQQPSQRT
jgi:pimeloyl-ACP methyl ester carboxylesterase